MFAAVPALITQCSDLLAFGGCLNFFAGTAIGFISLFSYAGVSVAGKVCGNLAQSSGGWRLPVLVMVVTATVGAALFSCLWCVRADVYAD